MAALRSFSSTSLSFNDNIVIRLCGRTHLHTGKPGKSNMFSARVKTTASKQSESTERKWIFTVSFKIQLPETFKPIATADRNGQDNASRVLHSKLCQSGFTDALIVCQLSQSLWRYVCIKTMHGSQNCVSKFKYVHNRPTAVHYWEHCYHLFEVESHAMWKRLQFTELKQVNMLLNVHRNRKTYYNIRDGKKGEIIYLLLQ